MQKTYFKEIFEYPIKEFKNHLEWENNERIIFSGKYGMGKTKFLENFFSIENQKSLYDNQKYNIYKLFPANYSIASNDDIIRYIKYDIIIEMLKQSISLNDVKLKLQDTLPNYIFKNLDKVMAALVYMIPKVGKEIVDSFDKIDKLKEEYLKYHDEINKSSGDRLVEYLEAIELKEGSIYESDITTKIIAEVISADDEKESILLIDDADRLDPEHIFRILNVFASHFDSNSTSSSKNKFNFDKIIIVCDFNNIRNIFHHRYGDETDFLGYIDKFYSCDVYYFDNKIAIQKIITNIFSSIVLPANQVNYSKFYFQNEFLIGIISALLFGGHLSLRNIIKIYNRKISYHSEILNFPGRYIQTPAWKLPITIQIKLLKDFFGDFYSFKKLVVKLSEHAIDTNSYDAYLGDLLYLLSYATHKFDPKQSYSYIYRGISLEIEPKLNSLSDQLERTTVYNAMDTPKDQAKSEVRNYYRGGDKIFFEALGDSIDLLNSIGFLK